MQVELVVSAALVVLAAIVLRHCRPEAKMRAVIGPTTPSIAAALLIRTVRSQIVSGALRGEILLPAARPAPASRLRGRVANLPAGPHRQVRASPAARPVPVLVAVPAAPIALAAAIFHEAAQEAEVPSMAVRGDSTAQPLVATAIVDSPVGVLAAAAAPGVAGSVVVVVAAGSVVVVEDFAAAADLAVVDAAGSCAIRRTTVAGARYEIQIREFKMSGTCFDVAGRGVCLRVHIVYGCGSASSSESSPAYCPGPARREGL